MGLFSISIKPGYANILAPKVRVAFGDVLDQLTTRQRSNVNVLIAQAVKRRGAPERVTVAELEGIKRLILNELSL